MEPDWTEKRGPTASVKTARKTQAIDQRERQHQLLHYRRGSLRSDRRNCFHRQIRCGHQIRAFAATDREGRAVEGKPRAEDSGRRYGQQPRGEDRVFQSQGPEGWAERDLRERLAEGARSGRPGHYGRERGYLHLLALRPGPGQRPVPALAARKGLSRFPGRLAAQHVEVQLMLLFAAFDRAGVGRRCSSCSAG